ncbi:MAG: hypothetical protein HY904_16040 [Deltaproteobacteria bacterium]|nr:hypothetical protein [Deltaproteobacteria bacterium]
MTWQAWGVLLVAAGCRAAVPTGAAEAGVAELTGARLERMHTDHVVLSLGAPRATLSLDGDRVRLEQPEGWLQAGPDAGRVALRAAVVEASLGRGTAVAEDARATDSQGRTLQSPRVTLVRDAGVVEAVGPVVLGGANVRITAAGGARVDLATEQVDLAGPVEAWVAPPGGAGPDGGGVP